MALLDQISTQHHLKSRDKIYSSISNYGYFFQLLILKIQSSIHVFSHCHETCRRCWREHQQVFSWLRCNLFVFQINCVVNYFCHHMIVLQNESEVKRLCCKLPVLKSDYVARLLLRQFGCILLGLCCKL